MSRKPLIILEPLWPWDWLAAPTSPRNNRTSVTIQQRGDVGELLLLSTTVKGISVLY
jgi:hypothetical protein